LKLESYWLDTAPAFANAAAGPVAGRTDVAIIGGGYTGLSAGLALAKRKASVVVLEAGRVAGEASGRNGGQCNTGLAHDYATLVQSIGRERARQYYLAYQSAVDTVEQIAKSEGIDCEFRRGGRLKLAAKPKHYDKLARTAEVLRAEVDQNVHVISRDRIRDEVNSDQFYGGLLQTTSAQLHAGKLGVGLAQAAARHGCHVYEFARVNALQKIGGQRYRITTERGEIEAAQVLVATGSTSNGPFTWFQRRLAPVGSFIVCTEPLGADLLKRLLPAQRSYVTSRNIGNYFRVTGDGRLLFGGRARFAMSNPRSDQKSGGILRAAMSGMFPELAKARIDYCWGGLVDMTTDRFPRAGEQDGLYYAMGYSGHGVQMSVHMGQMMADVLEGKTAANPWRLDWPAIPGHYGKPWFLPLVGAYYRVLDVLQ
jgi:glycine/D-amino acid oxidase-like deaminating enzyme